MENRKSPIRRYLSSSAQFSRNLQDSGWSTSRASGATWTRCATRSATRQGFLAEDSTLTLREGLAEYYASDPRLRSPERLHPRVRAILHRHDVAHVVFGCDTSIRDELILSRWMLLGSVDPLPIYIRGLFGRGTRTLLLEFFRKARPLAILLGLLDGFRALTRSLAMKTRWPADESPYLDRRLNDLRRNFGIRVL